MRLGGLGRLGYKRSIPSGFGLQCLSVYIQDTQASVRHATKASRKYSTWGLFPYCVQGIPSLEKVGVEPQYGVPAGSGLGGLPVQVVIYP